MEDLTKGARALKARLVGELTQDWLAELLEVPQSMVSRWVNGGGRPKEHLRRALFDIFQIPEADWLTANEVALVKRIQKVCRAGGYATLDAARKVSPRTGGSSRRAALAD